MVSHRNFRSLSMRFQSRPLELDEIEVENFLWVPIVVAYTIKKELGVSPETPFEKLIFVDLDITLGWTPDMTPRYNFVSKQKMFRHDIGVR